MQTPGTGKLVDGKTVFLTGGGRGLGHAIAVTLASAGAAGTIFDALAEDEAIHPPEGWHYVQGDAGCEDEVSAAMQATHDRHGRLDIVVANAGVVPPWRGTASLDLGEWRETFAINVEGVAIALKHAALLMKGTGGSVIAMGSLNSWRGHPQQAAYVASKHAVLGLVRAAALDLGRDGIRINALAPGPVATDALVGRVEARESGDRQKTTAALEAMADAGALGRMASETDVANACLFLASELSAGITGQLVPVDAGLP